MITPDYLELSAVDLAASRSFYDEALGFTFTAYGDAAGGRVTYEPFSFPGGRRFQFLDPGDNELAVYQAG